VQIAHRVSRCGATTPQTEQIDVLVTKTTIQDRIAIVRLVSTDPSEFGVFGVGQLAHGVIAVGQFARGFIAFGQVAVGVVAVGQLSFSIVGVGQLGAGVAWFTGMLGLGGRGFCFRLIPGLDLPRTPPPEVALAAVWQGATQGFVRLGVAPSPAGPVLVSPTGQVVPVKFRPAVAWALASALQKGVLREVYAFLRREGDVVIADRLVEVPGLRKSGIPTWLNVVRLVLLAALATVWCWVFSEVVLGDASID
jgi:hypothetical protein